MNINVSNKNASKLQKTTKLSFVFYQQHIFFLQTLYQRISDCARIKLSTVDFSQPPVIISSTTCKSENKGEYHHRNKVWGYAHRRDSLKDSRLRGQRESRTRFYIRYSTTASQSGKTGEPKWISSPEKLSAPHLFGRSSMR